MVGAGVHVGNVCAGTVSSPQGVSNFTALGDEINVGARIASAAGPGELLGRLELCRMAHVETISLEHRELSLKGKQSPIEVAVIP